MAKIFQKIKKEKIWNHFGAKSGQKLIFLNKELSVFKYSSYLQLCQKSDRTNDLFLIKMPN